VRVRLSPKDLQKALNDDSEFRIAGRYWDGSLRFEFGAEVCRLELRGGEVVSIDTAAAEPGRGDVVIKAPVGDWAKLLEEVPPPFYGPTIGRSAGRAKFCDLSPPWKRIRRCPRSSAASSDAMYT
jgi:hypothetical protein